MSEVITLPVVTTLKLNPDRILQDLMSKNLESIVCIGFSEDGSFYFNSSEADAGTVMFYLEMAKKKLLDICEDIETQ